MKCNYKPPKLTKEEQQEFAALKTTLLYIDRLQIEQRDREMIQLHNDCDYEFTDDVGGYHSDGMGWNPQSVFCGECTHTTCEGCKSQYISRTDYVTCHECVYREDCDLIEEKDMQGCVLGEKEEES